MLLYFLLISLVILLSTIGYGLITTKLLKFENFNYNYGTIGILGLFSLSVLLSFTHLFFSHNYLHNLLVIIVGILALFLFKDKNFKQIKFVIIIFLFLFLGLLIAKTNEDFGYYHLPNSIQFAQQKLQFGLGNINHGFKHISTLFMLMSLNYLPFIDHYLFNLTNFLFLTFFITFIIKEIFYREEINLNISILILSLTLVLFLSKFSRLAEYGSDIAGQIVILLYIFFIFEFFFNKNIEKDNLNYFKLSIILSLFAITLKFISAIYIILFIPFLFITNNKKQKIMSLININFLGFIFLSIFLFFFLNFSSTGCLIYPVETTCFYSQFEWALSSDVIKYLNLHYEVWSKGGLGPGFSIENKKEYLQNLNWVTNWINVYFIGKFTDYILVILLIIFIYSIFFIKEFLSQKKNVSKKNINYLIFYTLFLILFFVWFLNFPTLRYAGYVIVFLLIVSPFAFYVSNRVNFSDKNNLKKIFIIILISYAIFLYKNVNRISNELKLSEKDHHNFKNFPFYWTNNKNYKKVSLNDHYIYHTKGKCWAVPSTCVRNLESLKIIKKNNYIFYIQKK